MNEYGLQCTARYENQSIYLLNLLLTNSLLFRKFRQLGRKAEAENLPFGRFYYEEAPGITFTRYLNDMERHRKVKSEEYARSVSRMSEVHALNRVANIMPREFHHGWSGMMKPGQTVEAMKVAEAQRSRDRTGIHTRADLLAEAGLA